MRYPLWSSSSLSLSLSLSLSKIHYTFTTFFLLHVCNPSSTFPVQKIQKQQNHIKSHSSNSFSSCLYSLSNTFLLLPTSHSPFMDFHKPENTTTTKRMMMMMKNKSSSSSSSPQKNPNNYDDHDHDHHQCSDNTTADQHDDTPITEEKKQKRYTSSATITSSKRYSGNSGGGGSSSGGGGGGGVVSCQAEKCMADLGEAKRYHRRHKVCEFHAKAPSVLVSGLRQRFCQQCSRFHELSEFDETKRSCRRRLAGHNERRRKNSLDQGEGGSSSQTKGSSPQIRADDQERSNGKSQISYAGTNNNGTSSFKQFQIR